MSSRHGHLRCTRSNPQSGRFRHESRAPCPCVVDRWRKMAQRVPLGHTGHSDRDHPTEMRAWVPVRVWHNCDISGVVTYFWRTVNLGSQFSRSTSGPMTVGARFSRRCCDRFALLVAPDHLAERALRRCRGFAIVAANRQARRSKAAQKKWGHVVGLRRASTQLRHRISTHGSPGSGRRWDDEEDPRHDDGR